MSGRRGPVLVTLVALVALVATLASVRPAAADQTVGRGPLDAVVAAAERYHDDCSTVANRLSVGELVALTLAPTFPETGSPSTQAPSPMTLSRYDIQSSLHSYGDPTTYARAFWHPGVGAWQWDDASLRGFSADQRIDSDVIADYTTAYMASRWCTQPSLASVWSIWVACGRSDRPCHAAYDALVDAQGQLRDVAVDEVVTPRGGMQQHTCTVGDADEFPCWYVDPDEAEGYAGFALPAWGRSPVTSPFLVYRADGREHRHWLSDDSGYDRDIRASLVLGQNSRGGLAWSTGSDLCDITRGVGRCDPLPPRGFDLSIRQIRGDYVPLAGDFDGDGVDDVFWYGPGAKPDNLWMGGVDDPSPRAVTVRGVYDPLVGDFDGDGHDDVFWYGPGSAPDSIWYGTTSGWRPREVTVRGTYEPVVLDGDGDGRDDVLWYGPGSASDSAWYGRSDGSFDPGPLGVRGTYDPIGGDFDGDGYGDVFWYGPGSHPDSIWYGTSSDWDRVTDINVRGTYEPATGDLDGDGDDDIVWYAPGEGSDSLWWGRDRGFTAASSRARIDGTFSLFSGRFGGVGEDLFFHRAGAPHDATWRWAGGS